MIRSMTFVCLFCTSTVVAQTTQPGAQTRVYDIRELLMAVPNFPFRGVMGMPTAEGSGLFGGGGGGGGGAPVVAEADEQGARKQRAEALIQLIMETIEPTSWRAADGPVGAVRELGGQLVITQTPQAQEQIATLLQQLRGDARIVRVQADWIMLTPKELAVVLDAGSKESDSPKIIDRDALTKIGAEAVHYRGEITCFNGQTVSISSGRARTVVYDGEPVVGHNAVGLNPSVKHLNTGAMLEITPTVLRDGDAAVVALCSIVAEWNEPTKAQMAYPATRPGASQLHEAHTAIDRLNILRQELRSSLRIPLNQPILVGGMTLEPTRDQPQGSQLYLVLQVSASR